MVIFGLFLNCFPVLSCSSIQCWYPSSSDQTWSDVLYLYLYKCQRFRKIMLPVFRPINIQIEDLFNLPQVVIWEIFSSPFTLTDTYISILNINDMKAGNHVQLHFISCIWICRLRLYPKISHVASVLLPMLGIGLQNIILLVLVRAFLNS